MSAIGDLHRIGRHGMKGILKTGFTLVELLVVMAIIATLAALVVPMVFSATETANRTECSNNMKAMAEALIQYKSQKGKRRFHPRLDGKKFVVALYRSGILPDAKVFICPSTDHDNQDGEAYGGINSDDRADVPDGTCSYAGRRNSPGSPFGIMKMANQERVPGSKIAVVCDGLVRVGDKYKFNHGDGANVLFLDGHIDFLDLKEDLGDCEVIGDGAKEPLDGLSNE